MPTSDKLAELSIREHEARLKHIDELMENAEAEKSQDKKVNDELATIRQEREKMSNYIEGLKQQSPQQFMEAAGPMVMWELIAEKLEHIIEKIKKGN